MGWPLLEWVEQLYSTPAFGFVDSKCGFITDNELFYHTAIPKKPVVFGTHTESIIEHLEILEHGPSTNQFTAQQPLESTDPEEWLSFNRWGLLTWNMLDTVPVLEITALCDDVTWYKAARVDCYALACSKGTERLSVIISPTMLGL